MLCGRRRSHSCKFACMRGRAYKAIFVQRLSLKGIGRGINGLPAANENAERLAEEVVELITSASSVKIGETNATE